MGRLPTFIIIGAMKAGTSSLAAYLARHPDVVISDPKEPSFFADPGNWHRGMDWYQELFPKGAAVAGEASTHYTMEPKYVNAPGRIHAKVPNARLIYLVRDPIERMRSMFIHEADKGRIREPSLSQVIERHPEYIEISRYGRQLAPYLDLFDPLQILVVTTDELHRNPDALVNRVLKHIGVDSSVTLNEPIFLNAGAQKRYINKTAYVIAKAAHRTGLRDVVPTRMRARLKHGLTYRFEENMLRIDKRMEAEIRSDLAPDMTVIRCLVHASGAHVPDWLKFGDQ